MSKMKYDRPIHRIIDERKWEQTQIRKKDLGNEPMIMNDTMKFGKYKGKKLRNIPTNYLEWLVTISTDSMALKYCKELANRPKYK